ncbi:UNVERIFIED_CONTAM: hypothetical protein K2H54_059734 [Gekko kuhli]
MGKTNAGKSKKNTASSVSSFFAKSTPGKSPVEDTPHQPKMAAAARVSQEDDTPLTRQDFMDAFHALEDNIAERIQTAVQKAIQPLSNDLKAITETLSEVAQAAESALEAATTTQEDIKSLQQAEEWSRSKIMLLENKLRDRNIKFRGLPEKSEGESQVKIFLATWLSTELSLEDGVAPLIDSAYRTGPLTKRNEKTPRDIIVTIPDSRTREPITLKLTENNTRFRWISPNEFMTEYQGQRLFAHDYPSGLKLLDTLGIRHEAPTPMGEDDIEIQTRKPAPRWSRLARGAPP